MGRWSIARVDGENLVLDGIIGMPDGTGIVRDRSSGPCAQAEAIGQALGEKLLAGGGREILRRLAQVRA